LRQFFLVFLRPRGHVLQEFFDRGAACSVTLRREPRERRASKGDGPGRSSFEARKSAHLRMTGLTLSLAATPSPTPHKGRGSRPRRAAHGTIASRQFSKFG
jgi:hypothetical protein